MGPIRRRHPSAGRTARTRPGRGFKLLELVVAVVVLGAGLAGLLLAFSTTARSDADPMVQRQLGAIAGELLEEIQLKPYAPSANAAPAGCARDTFNDVSDYHGYSRSGICTIDGVPIPALAAYAVSVSVTTTPLAGVAAAKRIAVTASRGGTSFTLVGWRTDFAS